MKKHSFSRLGIQIMLIFGFLILVSSNTSACWEKSQTQSNGSSTIDPTTEPNSIIGASVTKYGGYTYAYLSMYSFVSSVLDPNHDDLSSSADAWGIYTRDEWDWEGGGPPVAHTFTCTWTESFDWEIEGDADNLGSGSGISSAEVDLTVCYDSGPDDSLEEDHEVDFGSSATKTESSDWLESLGITWKPGNPPELEWDGDAIGSDNTYEDEPNS